jgi:hypothetical protein
MANEMSAMHPVSMPASEFAIKTRPWAPTRLSELRQRNIEVRVTDGVVEMKSSLMSTTHFLTFLVDVPTIANKIRRSDEEFDFLQAYLAQAYPNLIIPPNKPHKA